MRRWAWVLLWLLAGAAWSAEDKASLAADYKSAHAERLAAEPGLKEARQRLRQDGGSLANEGADQAWWDLPRRRTREGRLRGLNSARQRLDLLQRRQDGLLAREDALGARLRKLRLALKQDLDPALLGLAQAYDADRLTRLVKALEAGEADRKQVEAERKYFRDLKQVAVWAEEAEIALKILK